MVEHTMGVLNKGGKSDGPLQELPTAGGVLGWQNTQLTHKTTLVRYPTGALPTNLSRPGDHHFTSQKAFHVRNLM